MGDIRVRVVAADATFAGALTAFLAAEPTISVVEDTPVDLAVVAVEDVREAVADLGETPVLAIGPGNVDVMIAAFEAGALGYQPKDAPLSALRDAVLAVAEGQAVVPPAMLGALLKQVVRRRRTVRADLDRLNSLTKRERDVFDFLVRGQDRQSIASSLFISVGTVRTHLQHVFRKLDVHTHAELVSFAARCGLGTSESEDVP